MTIQTHTCSTIACDECGETLRPGDEFTPHFTSPEEARYEASLYYDWTRDGERDLCDQCTKSVACTRDGHRINENDGWCERCEQLIGAAGATS